MRTVAASLALLFAVGTQARPQSSWQKVDITSFGIDASSILNSITTAGNLALASVSVDPLYKSTRSIDGGQTWESPLILLAPLKLKSLSPGFLYGVRSDSNFIMTNINQGVSVWTVLRPALNMMLADVHFSNASPGQAWAVGDSPYVAITTNNWGNSPPPQIVRFTFDSVSMSAVQFLDDIFGFAIGRSRITGSTAGVILRTTDGGQNWQSRSLPDICSAIDGLTSIAADFVSPQIGWAVQTCGTTANFYKTIDGGFSWSLQDAKPFYQVLAVDAVDSLHAWAAGRSGVNGAIAKTSNGGSTWFFETVPQPSGRLLSLAMRDTSRGFACGEAATLLVYSPLSTDVPGEHSNRPKSFELLQNYPNPFNGETRIAFSLLKSQPVTLTIFNILGQPIRTLLEGNRPAGKNEVSWDGRDASGRFASSGIYFYKLSSAGEKQVRQMVLLK